MARKFVALIFLFGILCSVAAGFVVARGYFFYSRDLPDFGNLADYNPQAVTNVYSNDGTLIAEFFDERRYPSPLSEVPLVVRQAFLAAEDSAFYDHIGIDPIGILRAAVKNALAGRATQGASTITQQVIKNVLLTREKSLSRKIKEAILAHRLEQQLSKDEILEIYLNQIYFGNGSYGIKAAARSYFHTDLSDVTLAQAALLAGLPKAPSRYNPIKNFKAAKHRQRYVLSQMVNAGYISQGQMSEALQEQLQLFSVSSDNIFHAPYYVGEVRRRFSELWKGFDIDKDGLEIHTALDIQADKMAQRALRRGLREIDKRRGWRGPLAELESANRSEFTERFSETLYSGADPSMVVPALVESIEGNSLDLFLGGETTARLDIRDAKWARRFLERIDGGEDERVRTISPLKKISRGSVLEVSVSEEKPDKSKQLVVSLDQTPELEAALVLIHPSTGKVLTTIGGYDYSRSQFNRATQGRRQPGSAFKPMVYLAGIDKFGYTPATVVDDSPRTFRVGSEFWSPANYDRGFLGPITLRTALQKSRNIISADIISRTGVDVVIRYAKKMGIESPLGRNLSLSLGSSEVTPLEITRAYGVFSNKGVLADSVFITKLSSQEGDILNTERSKDERVRRVISEQSSFVMANMMKGVVQYGTGYLLKKLERPVAGKTGTSNDQMDGWFVGYTPEWALGVWVGFDVKKSIGRRETGGKVAAPIWLYFMQDFLAAQDRRKREALASGSEGPGSEKTIKPADFVAPDGVSSVWINRTTGTLASSGEEGAFLEYFVRGTEPKVFSEEAQTGDYWDYPEL